jgi:glycosyltransferase involved in cell wall biosynthesis
LIAKEKNLGGDVKPLHNVKLARVSTVSFFIDTQLHDQIKMTIASGADVSVIASEPALNRPIDDCKYFSIDIPRQIHPAKDMIALIKLYRLFRDQQFDIVHSTTPKAGLLCALAGIFAAIPIRVHTFTGQPWVALSGTKRILSKLADKCIGIFNTACYADSVSQKEFLVSKKIIKPSKISVVGRGSLAGVDVQRFNPREYSEVERSMIRQSLQIPVNSIVLLFVGRIVRDKGVIELVKAFKDTFANDPNVYLLFVGPQELSLSDLGVDMDAALNNRIKFTGYTDTPERYMSVSKMLCIPSYREGFGTVVIEAAAMGMPAIGSNIYGLSDSIIHGETGLLVKPKHSVELAKALHKLVYDTELCCQLGQSAQRRALEFFSSTVINQKIIREYEFLLRKKRYFL